MADDDTENEIQTHRNPTFQIQITTQITAKTKSTLETEISNAVTEIHRKKNDSSTLTTKINGGKNQKLKTKEENLCLIRSKSTITEHIPLKKWRRIRSERRNSQDASRAQAGAAR